jgi:hypothetical protein
MNIFKDYLDDFKRCFGFQRLFSVSVEMILGLIFIIMNGHVGPEDIVGLLIFLTIISGSYHFVSLPVMMYVVPYTKQMREDYIRRMLKLKVGIPLMVSGCVDIVMLAFDRTLLKAVVLQLVTVFFISYLFGTLNDEPLLNNVYKPAFGRLREFIGAILMLCYMLSLVMFCICVSQISNVEFGVILIILLAVFGTISLNVHRRWKVIRSKLASYEMVMEMEVK